MRIWTLWSRLYVMSTRSKKIGRANYLIEDTGTQTRVVMWKITKGTITASSGIHLTMVHLRTSVYSYLWSWRGHDKFFLKKGMDYFTWTGHKRKRVTENFQAFLFFFEVTNYLLNKLNPFKFSKLLTCKKCLKFDFLKTLKTLKVLICYVNN